MSRRPRIGEERPVIAPEPTVRVDSDGEMTSDAPVRTPRDVESRVAAIEATVSALIFSTFAARDSDGKPLTRCRCGLFATRHHVTDHRVAGAQNEFLCDSCSPSSPLATKGVPQHESPLLAPADMAHVVKVNRSLDQARAWGTS